MYITYKKLVFFAYFYAHPLNSPKKIIEIHIKVIEKCADNIFFEIRLLIILRKSVIIMRILAKKLILLILAK